MGFQFNPITGKLDLVGSGGAAQVNSDWNATSGVAQILNKPTIPAAQVNSDWNATSGVAQILNKPTIQTFDQSLNTTSNVSFNQVLANVPDQYFSYLNAGGIGGAGPITQAWSFESITGNGSVSGAFVCGSLLVSGQSPAFVGVANTFTRGQTITAAANTSALTASYSVTGANTTPILNLTGTWNTTGAASGFLLDITDTNSAAASKFFEVKSSGTSLFSINKGTASNSGGFTFLAGSGGSFSFNSGSTGTVQFQRQGTTIFSARADSITTFNFGSAFAVGWSSDTYLNRDAANTLALRNGTNANTLRVYGSFTDSSNGRRLDITSTTAGIFTLTATGNGTGASGNILKLTAPILLPSASVSLATNGDLAFEATSNTSLAIKYRGSDGTTRSATLMLI